MSCVGTRQIVTTTETPSGQVVDWIPIESQLPQGERLAEPSSGRIRVEMPDGERADRLVIFELEQEGAARGPEGTVPVPVRAQRRKPRYVDDRIQHSWTGEPTVQWRTILDRVAQLRSLFAPVQ